MGVSKHIIYLRKDSIPALLIGNPRLARLVQKGKILLVMWVLGEGGGEEEARRWCIRARSS